MGELQRFFPTNHNEILTLYLNQEALADWWRDAVVSNAQVGSHVCSLDVVEQERLSVK
jgi:hypothetical protein